MNLSWENNIYDFKDSALNRSKINTPSYNQVIQPLYKSSINRWERYEEAKKIIPPLVNKWINTFDYL